MKLFSLDFEDLHLVVEFDQGMTFWYRARLIVNGEVVDERSVLWGTTMLRTTRPRALRVSATAGFLGPRKVVLHDDAGPIPFVKGR